jgi:chemotaxis protein MotB
MSKRKKKPPESDEAPGAPDWMVTFSDCMTLLLTFFVLLLSFSSFDNKIFSDLRVVYSQALNSITDTPRIRPRDALTFSDPIQHKVQRKKGSEKPTLAEKLEEALMKEAGLKDLHGGMVFLIPSQKVFWGRGAILTQQGRDVMNLMEGVLQRVPGRVVVSETGPTEVQNGRSLGLPRAWAIMDYLTKKRSMDPNRFSISAAGIVARDGSGSRTSGRMVEITLLKRNVYN